MTTFEVPTQPNLPWYTFRITLSGTVFTLVLRYNSRMARWILDVNDASGTPLLDGIPLLINRNLTIQYVIPGLPTGFFFCLDNSAQGSQPTLNSFQVDHTIYYVDPE